MWVQLTTQQIVCTAGDCRIYYPGDFVSVSKNQALAWLSAQVAQLPAALKQTEPLYAACGVVTPQPAPQLASIPALPVTVGEPALLYPVTILWDGNQPLPLHLLPAIVGRMEHGYEVAACMVNYTSTLAEYGMAEEQAETLAVIHDLRVPVYTPGLVVLRKSPGALAFFHRWQRESGEPHLAFSRALFLTQPVFLPLPMWSVP